MKATDKQKIVWSDNISRYERVKCREMINKVRDQIGFGPFCISCSGGLDSTVLAYLLFYALRVLDNKDKKYLCYINHNLRPHQNQKEIDHVHSIGEKLGYEVIIKKGSIQDDQNVQFEAHNVRYNALKSVAEKIGAKVLLAHHMDDNAESKLFQFLTGRAVIGMRESFVEDNISFHRPILSLTKDDLKLFAKVWNIQWCEDDSNSTNDYTRNRIRHDMIPYIKEHINPGIVEMLGKK